MPKLHELLAIESNLETQAAKVRADLANTFEKKRHLFEEKRLLFTPNTEGAQVVTEQQTDIQTTVQKELAWVQNDLRALEKQKDSYRDLLSPEEMQSEAFSHLQRCVIQLPCPLLPLRKEAFSK